MKLDIHPPNESKLLFEDDARLRLGSSVSEGHAKVVLQMLPRPSVVIEFEGQPTLEGLFQSEDPKFVFELKNDGTKVSAHAPNASLGELLKLSAPIAEPFTRASEGKVKTVLLDVLNFSLFHAEWLEGHIGEIEVLRFEVHGWACEILQNKDSKAAVQVLKSTSGYGITHRCRVSFAKPTGYEEAFDIIKLLGKFLSFLRGFRCLPCLPTFYAENGEKLGEVIESPSVDRYQSVLSWFEPNTCQMVKEIFPGFYSLWGSEVWPTFRIIRRGLSRVSLLRKLSNRLEFCTQGLLGSSDCTTHLEAPIATSRVIRPMQRAQGITGLGLG